MVFKYPTPHKKGVLNHSQQAAIVIDLEEKIKSFNQTAQDWVAQVYDTELAKGKPICDCVCLEDIPDLEEAIGYAKQGEVFQIEKAFNLKSGKVGWFKICYSSVINDKDEVVGIRQTVINIDNEKEAIEKLTKNEERYRAMVQNSSDIITVLDSDGIISYVSPSVDKILGYKPEELIGKSAFEYIFPLEVEKAKENFHRSIQQSGMVQLNELRLRDSSENWIEVEVAVNNLLNEPSMKGVVVNCRDITKRKQVEAALHQQYQKEQALSEFTHALRRYFDTETVCAIAVKEISKLIQVDYIEVQQYIHSRSVWLTLAEARQKAHMPRNEGVEFSYLDSEAIRQIHQLKIVKLREEHQVLLLIPLHFQERLWGSLKLMREEAFDWSESELELLMAIVTQLAIAIQQAQLYQQSSAINADLERQVQERTVELQQKVHELQQLNVLKDDFLSTVSHELRTPLANMKMAIQMLKIADQTDRRHRYLEILQSECSRETELINDLLDLQRLEVETYAISLEKIRLQEWLPSIIEPFISRFQQHKQNLTVDVPADLPPIESDRLSLGRVLAELLNNACKYTPGGDRIVLSVSHSDKICDRTLSLIPVMEFTISNQAEIPAHELSRIFEKFYRVPNADPWKQGGTGLGLALTQKLVEKMEGKIEVKSRGGWTTFIVQIPTAPSQQLRDKGHRKLV